MQWIILFALLGLLSVFVLAVALLICQMLFGKLPWEDENL